MDQPLTPDQIAIALADLPDWSHQDDRIKKSFSFDNFRASMAFIVRLSFEAEQRDHHPEIFNCWNRVEIALNTHSAGGKVTAKDVDLATAIETLGN